MIVFVRMHDVQIKETACMEERDGRSTTDCYTTLSCLFPFVLFAVFIFLFLCPLFYMYVKSVLVRTNHKDVCDYQFCASGFPSRLSSFTSPWQTTNPLEDVTTWSCDFLTSKSEPFLQLNCNEGLFRTGEELTKCLHSM